MSQARSLAPACPRVVMTPHTASRSKHTIPKDMIDYRVGLEGNPRTGVDFPSSCVIKRCWKSAGGGQITVLDNRKHMNFVIIRIRSTTGAGIRDSFCENLSCYVRFDPNPPKRKAIIGIVHSRR